MIIGGFLIQSNQHKNAANITVIFEKSQSKVSYFGLKKKKSIEILVGLIGKQFFHLMLADKEADKVITRRLLNRLYFHPSQLCFCLHQIKNVVYSD